jgi:hypothetical protein
LLLLLLLLAAAPVSPPSGEASEEELKERQAKAMADPDVQNILMDPIMRQVGLAVGADDGLASLYHSRWRQSTCQHAPGVQALLMLTTYVCVWVR